MAAFPSEEDQEALRLLIHGDQALQGGGFAFRDGEWIVLLSPVRGVATGRRPDEFRGYRIVWEDIGPVHGLGEKGQ
ncbi:hypothetical protein AB0878_05905 [Amycolatopsis sp. NPDC047767]|uniref:hypothetical protein n=1 Tax=Amycolatopsis sp. NPDC047767 TaxID=3156765 RepID=UPI0034512075